MISVEEAFKFIDDAAERLNAVEMPLSEAVSYVLAQDVFSTLAFPPFDQSAMDGYAVSFGTDPMKFMLVDEIKTGDSASDLSLNPGEACRIFTGAMLPKNTQTVVKQEDVEINDNWVCCNKRPKVGDNIRNRGEQIMEGELAVKEGTLLNPGAIGFLATLGVQKVSVYRKPRIQIMATGNELIEAGNALLPGQIFESNALTLTAALKEYGFNAKTSIVPDSYSFIKTKLMAAIANNDLVLITGGISVGDYDFVGPILKELGVVEKFYKVKQKPGKPLFFGTKNNTLIFALPGNPAAVMTSFYIYVLKALASLVGRKEDYLKQKKVQINQDFEKSSHLTFFLKGRIADGNVDVLPAQSSAMLKSFIHANCLIQLDENKDFVKEGEEVLVHLI